MPAEIFCMYTKIKTLLLYSLSSVDYVEVYITPNTEELQCDLWDILRSSEYYWCRPCC